MRRQKKLGSSSNSNQEKKPLPQGWTLLDLSALLHLIFQSWKEFPRNGRSDGGRFEVEQYKPCPHNSNRQSCHPLTVVLLPALAWSKPRSTDPVTKDCRKSPHSQSTVTRHLQVNNFDSRIRAAPILRHTSSGKQF